MCMDKIEFTYLVATVVQLAPQSILHMQCFSLIVPTRNNFENCSSSESKESNSTSFLIFPSVA